MKSSLLLILIAISAAIPAKSQRRPAPEAPRHVCPVVLLNETGREIAFETSSDDKDPWHPGSIESDIDESRCIGSEPGRLAEVEKIYIRIETRQPAGTTALRHYKLLAGNRYQFFSNPACACWDLSLIVPPK